MPFSCERSLARAAHPTDTPSTSEPSEELGQKPLFVNDLPAVFEDRCQLGRPRGVGDR